MSGRDITERLRILADEWSLRSYTITHALHESADAIEAMRAEVAQVREYADALNARCIEETAEIGRLRAEVARLQADGIHTCHDECPRIACVQRREIERLQALLREACDELDPHGTRDGRPIVHQHIIDLRARIDAVVAREAER